MNKKHAIAITAIAIIVILAVIIAIWQPWRPAKTEQNTPSTDTSQPSPTPNKTPEQPAAESRERYVSYSESAFNNAEGRRVLFFHADWCPQCRALDADIKQHTIPENMTVFKVNYDTATALKEKYGVTLQTTLVEVDKNGKEIKKVVAYDDPTFEFMMRELGE